MSKSDPDPRNAILEDLVAEGNGIGGRIRRLTKMQASQIILIWLAIVLIFSALAPTTFLSAANFREILVNISIMAVLGVGTTFIIVTAGIDLSMGSVLVFSGVISALTMGAFGAGDVLADPNGFSESWMLAAIGIVVAMASGTCWGWLNGFLVAKAKVPPMIVTLGTYGAALGLAQVLTGGLDKTSVPNILVDTIGFGRVFEVPILLIIALVVVVLGTILLGHTKFGLHTCAVGSNPEACRRAGINIDRHLIKVYTLAGFLAGTAGILNLCYFRNTTIAGQANTNLDVIAGVVIGGTSLFGGIGTVVGTVVGLLIPATLRNGFIILGVPPYWQQVVVGAFLIIAVYVDQVRRASAARAGAPKKKGRPRGGNDPENA
jgi:ribose transport system permease protein